MMRQLARKVGTLLWLLPGLLLWASFPPMGETTDVLFALAPLVWVSRCGDVRTSVRRWFANGLFFWVATLSWMPAIVKNGGPWPLVILGWAGLAAYCALYFAAYGWLSAVYWRWVDAYWKRLLGLLLVEPVLWAGLELVRSRLMGGFAWNQLGVAPVNAGFGAPAALGGVYLVSACVILVNGTLASIAERLIASFRRRPLTPLRSVETLLPFLVVFAVYAAANRLPRECEQAHQVQRDTLGVAMVQRNFPCCFSGRQENPIVAYSNLLSHVALLKPDLTVLSESALAEFGALDRPNAAWFLRYVQQQTGGAVLAGGGRRSDGREYNSAVLFGAEASQIYDKVHLVPFGEFIPGDKWITALQRLAPVGSCTPGELKLLTLPAAGGSCGDSVPLGVAICFEDTDAAQMRRLARLGARLLVFITNDSWFSQSSETVQHAWQSRARAIETGLAAVRVGNSGVTGSIMPDGRVTWLVGEDGKPLVDRPGTMFDRIPLAAGAPHTPYVRWGDFPLGLIFALLITSMILINYTNYAKRRSLSV